MEEYRDKVIARSPFISSNGLNTIEMSANEQIYECRICENSFSSPIQLTIHYVICHRLLPCIKCLQLFLNRCDLDEHITHQHANDDTNCSQCLLAFVSARSLIDHLYNVHQKKYCQMCSALVKSNAINTFQRHVEQVHKILRQIRSNDPIFSFADMTTDETYECLICRQQIQIVRLFIHTLSFHKFSLGFIFHNLLEKRYTSHVLRSLENVDRPNDFDAKILCTICKHKFTSHAPKIMHHIYCNGQRVCRRCYNRFDSDEDFDVHVNFCGCADTIDLDACKFCADKGIDNQNHLSHVHKIDPAIYSENVVDLYSTQQTSWIVTNYLCNFCGKDLTANIPNIDTLVKHFVIHHKISQNCLLTFLKKSTIKFQCEDANDSRRQKVQAIEVANKNNSDGGVIFDFDSKMVKVIYSSATDSDSSEAEENKATPSVRSAYICTFCPFKTAVKCMLATHLSQKHGFALKPMENRCNACKKVFTTYAYLQRHYKNVHHKGNANNYKCTFCLFACKGKQKMRRHIALHVESSYHPCSVKTIGFNCKYCQHSFWVAEKLNEHMFNRHADKFEQNFLMCSICAATFINKTCLRQHHDIKHPNVDEFTLFLYQCKICCTTYSNVNLIRLHMNEMHPKLRSSYCAELDCHQYFDGDESFQAHYAQSHWKKLFKCTKCPKLFETKVYAIKHYEEMHYSNDDDDGGAKRLKPN